MSLNHPNTNSRISITAPAAIRAGIALDRTFTPTDSIAVAPFAIAAGDAASGEQVDVDLFASISGTIRVLISEYAAPITQGTELQNEVDVSPIGSFAEASTNNIVKVVALEDGKPGSLCVVAPVVPYAKPA